MVNKALPAVSIVIPAYNAEETIGPLLDSLLALDYPDFEVIVVNDGSEDGTKEIAEQYSVRLIDQPNRGASAARDAGLRAAKRGIVAYVDSDVTVERDWLRHLVEPLDDHGVAASTGCTIFLRNETCSSWMRSLDIERRNSRRKVDTRLANGPNSAFRKDVLLGIGGFDPNWFHAEDTEVSYKLWGRGYRIRYVPEAIVHHVPEEDWRDFLRKRYRDARAFARVLARYPRSAFFEDDFVETGMKIQPPLFLAIIVLAVSAALLAFTSLFVYALVSLAGFFLAGVLLNLREAASVAHESKHPRFFFIGLGLGVVRGFAWGVGLGIGTARQVSGV